MLTTEQKDNGNEDIETIIVRIINVKLSIRKRKSDSTLYSAAGMWNVTDIEY